MLNSWNLDILPSVEEEQSSLSKILTITLKEATFAVFPRQ